MQLWRSLGERPYHLRGLEAAVLGALTASGAPAARLSAWIGGSHRAVLAALVSLDRMVEWRARANAATDDLQSRTPSRWIDALAACPMLGAAQAEAETGASRAAVL